MQETEFLTILGLGFVLGLRHALDTDHLAAVSTILAQRPSLRASGMVGFSWGLGHTVVLLLAGSVVLVLRVSIPEPVAIAAEFGVGMMLVFLGGTLAIRLIRERWHVHAHDHAGAQHVHLHSHALVEDHGHGHWWRDSIFDLCDLLGEGRFDEYLAPPGASMSESPRTDGLEPIRNKILVKSIESGPFLPLRAAMNRDDNS